MDGNIAIQHKRHVSGTPAPQRRDDSTEQLQPIPTHRNTSCSEHNQDRTTDSVIDVERVRYLPALATPTGTAVSGVQIVAVSSIFGIVNGQLVYGTGIATGTTVTGVGIGTVNISIPTSGVVSGTLTFTTPNTLYRDDTVASEWYEAPLYQLQPGTPQTFSLSSEPPLSWQVDIPPNQPGTYEAIVLQSGAPFNPPTPTLIGIWR